MNPAPPVTTMLTTGQGTLAPPRVTALRPPALGAGLRYVPGVTRLFLSPPDVGPRERELLLDAFDSNWIAPLGPHVDAFEREFAEFVGVSHAAALSSGTAALHLGLILLGVGPGDEV